MLPLAPMRATQGPQTGRRPTGARDSSIDSGPSHADGKADVSITPDGAFAIFRREGSAVVTVIDLADGSRWSWTLSSAVTDLDLADTGNRAVAVLRNEGRIAVLPVPGRGASPFDDLLVSGETVGSVAMAPHGEVALLYTNAVAVNRITVLNLSTPRLPRRRAARAGAFGIPSPTQSTPSSFTTLSGAGVHETGAFSDALAAVKRPSSGHRRAVLSVAIFPDGDRAIIQSVRDDAKRLPCTWRDCLRCRRSHVLASPPAAAGFADRQGSLRRPGASGGRVSFIEAATSKGVPSRFELGAGVVDGRRRTEVKMIPRHPPEPGRVGSLLRDRPSGQRLPTRRAGGGAALLAAACGGRPSEWDSTAMVLYWERCATPPFSSIRL